MALDFSAASAVLKDDYQPTIRENINQQVMLVNQIGQNTEDIEGQEGVLSLHTGRNTGVGARAEAGTLPTAGSQGYTRARIPMKYLYGRMQVTGPTIAAMKSNRGSFTRAIDSESKGLVNDLKRDYNRQLYTPSNGTFATVASGTSSTVFVVTDAAEARRFDVGMSIDIYSSAFVAQDTSAVVSAVVVSTKTVTVSSALGGTPSAGDIIVRAGVVPTAVSSKATEDNQYEVHGLLDIVDDSTLWPWLHGVDGSSNTVWASYQTAVNAAPTDTVFEAAMDEANLLSGEDLDLWILSHAGARAYAATLKTQKRFSPNTVELQGGFKAITVQTGRGEIPLWAERDCPDQTALGVCTGYLTEYIMEDWQFMDQDGSVLNRVANTDSYEATMFSYRELSTDQRDCHAKLTGLSI